MENTRQKIAEIITHTHKTPLEQADEILLLFSVVGRSEQLKPEPQICYKSNEPCKYDCSGLCKESY